MTRPNVAGREVFVRSIKKLGGFADVFESFFFDASK